MLSFVNIIDADAEFRSLCRCRCRGTKIDWHRDTCTVGVNVDVYGNVYVDVDPCAEEDTGYRHIDLRASIWLRVLQIQKHSTIRICESLIHLLNRVPTTQLE